MNYRHAFHAGNFADVFKHVLLVRALVYLTLKDAPLRYLDTHAGAGMYDVGSAEARRTGEWEDGVGRMLAATFPPAVAALLAPWREAAGLDTDRARKRYPGSPLLARHFARRADRLIFCELNSGDAGALRRFIGKDDKRVKTLTMDGYMALNAYVPPPERRGLVLIDPPFEEPGEFHRLGEGLAGAWSKWPTGVYLAWYPRKDLVAVAEFRKRLAKSGVRRMLAIELDVETARADGPLAGTGLIVVNPPHVLEAEAKAILPELTRVLGRGRGAMWRMDWLAGE